MATRKMARRCTIADAASEQHVTEPEHIEELLKQKTAARAQATGKEPPQREEFNAEVEHKVEQKSLALEKKGEGDNDVGDVWADMASVASVMRLEGDLDRLGKRVCRVEVIVKERSLKVVANIVRLAPSARQCTTKDFHDVIKKHGGTLTSHAEVVSIKTGQGSQISK